MSEFLGAVLTGGMSTRMGEDKTTVEVAGRPMSYWVTRALGAAMPGTNRLIALGPTPLGQIPNLEDRPGDGPLSGLAALADLPGGLGPVPDAVLLVAVDQPWVRPETLRMLLNRYTGRAVVPIDGGARQVTCALYPWSFVTAAAAGAVAGRGFQTLLDEVEFDGVEDDWSEWGEDGRSWFSVDTPADVIEGLRRFGGPGKSSVVSPQSSGRQEEGNSGTHHQRPPAVDSPQRGEWFSYWLPATGYWLLATCYSNRFELGREVAQPGCLFDDAVTL
jgi:molybdopterin-guanine dinucleotide biosynthesis protein A